MTWRQERMVAVKIGAGPTIMLQSGAWFDFCAPSASEFTIEDIAHGLGNICRYSGQCRRFLFRRRAQHPCKRDSRRLRVRGFDA